MDLTYSVKYPIWILLALESHHEILSGSRMIVIDGGRSRKKIRLMRMTLMQAFPTREDLQAGGSCCRTMRIIKWHMSINILMAEGFTTAGHT